MSFTVGIDLGGTSIRAGAADGTGRLLSRVSGPTDASCGPALVCRDVARLAREAARAAGIGWEDVAAVGVGAPGIVNKRTGTVERAANLGLEDAPLFRELKALLERPLFLENDANAAALGEWAAGAARGCSSAVVITLGTGVGAGVILEGKLYTGFNFAGGELGHMVISRGGRLCTCGRRGCFEAYASATGLAAMGEEAMERYPESRLCSLCPPGERPGGKEIFAAASEGDAAAREAVEEYLDALSCGIANVINIFQPQILCLGGGVSRQGESLLEALRPRVYPQVFRGPSTPLTRLALCALGDGAGLVGAALLPRLEWGKDVLERGE